MSECDSSDHPVSVVVVVVVVVVVGMNFFSFFTLFSNHCTDVELWVFKSRLYDLFPSNYANELLGSYVTCIFD